MSWKKFVALTSLVTLISCSSSMASKSPASIQEDLELQKAELLRIVNAHRKTLGLEVLGDVNPLNNEAQEHSSNMGSGETPFGHLGFSERCKRAKAEMGLQSYGCGEIVAAGQKDPQAAFNAWLNSPGHKIQMEKPTYRYTGLGIGVNPKGRMYWTMMFLK